MKLRIHCPAVAASLAFVVLLASRASADEPSPWMLDLNLGVPKLKSGSFGVAGDGMVGYAGPQFGAALRGSGSTYELSSSAYDVETQRGDVAGEAWWLSGGPHAEASFELRASGGSSLYSSTYTPKNSALGYWHDEDSWMGRGGLLMGGRFRAKSVFEMQVLAGGGLQLESRDLSSVDPKAPSLLNSTSHTSARFEGRLTALYRVLPQSVSLRLSGEGQHFSITRESFVVASVSKVGVIESSSSFRQLELRARLSVLGDFAAFYGFIPTVWGGVEYVRMSGDGTAVSSTVPLVGLGLLRSWL